MTQPPSDFGQHSRAKRILLATWITACVAIPTLVAGPALSAVPYPALPVPYSVLSAVPYPDYKSYQAKAYEQLAAQCMARFGLQPGCAQLLKEAIEFNPESVSSHMALGSYYFNEAEYARALAEFASVIRINPEQKQAIIALGDIYLLQGKFSLSEEKYQQYLEESPQEPMAYLNLATLFAVRGDRIKALEKLTVASEHGFTDWKALENDPRWAEYLQLQEFRALLSSHKKAPTP